MKKITTHLNRTSFYSAVLFLLFSVMTLVAAAHSVTGYTASCNTGPVYSIQPIVTNVNSSSNYRWQYKNSSGTWVCIVNGSNTINGNTYTVSGAVYNLTTSPGPIIFSNPNTGLNGVVIRCVISDGSGVNPCNMPAGNTWNSDANSVNITLNVTNTPCAGGGSIGDRVWYDANGNGLQDASETTGITGVTVQLRNAAGTVISTTATNSTGYYLFSGLSAGNYTVVFPVSISGAVVTQQHVGTNVDIDSDPSTTTGITQVIALATNQNITNIDAGYCPTTLELGNRVWYDGNNNGINDSEDGIRGVTLNLYKDDNNDNVADGPAIATTITDADGYYMFSNLSPGNYIVGAVTPAGYVSSSVNGGDPDNDINLDDNGMVTVGNETRGLAITLIAGTEYDGSTYTSNTNITYDFGFLPDCACTNSTSNLLVNGSFENGTTGWSWSNGALTTGTGYIACGAANGFLQWTTGTAKFWQDVTNANIAAGSTVFFSGYAGTHTAGQSCSPKLSLLFLNSAGTVISQTDVAITRDVDINHNQLAYYSITAVAPAGTVKVRVQGTITCDWLKLDAFCLTASAPMNLGDKVWYDRNNNGTQDAGEPGVAGATVKLYSDANGDNVPDGAAIATTTTNASGIYAFANIAPGKYIVGVTIPAGYAAGATTATSASPDNDNNTDNNGVTTVSGELRSNFITLTAGGEPTTDGDGANGNLTLDFGLKGTGAIGDFVWNDANGNGLQDAGEAGIANATVTLTYPDGTTLTTTTNASGIYAFTNLAPGTYSVSFTTPAGYTPTTSNVGADDNIDSDPVAGIVTGIAINGNTNNTIDAGFYQLMNLGDKVWYDRNNNGTQDAGEPAINGATVKLYADANGDNVPDGAALQTTTTNAAGIYGFSNMAPGKYIAGVTIPAGYAAGATTATSATPDNDNNTDNNGVTTVSGELRSNYITLINGTEPTGDGDGANGNLTLDFGLKGSGAIGDFVWNDLNGNGLQDSGEPGIAGVTVTLTYPDGTTLNTTTNASGIYAFTNLAPGSYSVTFTTPAGYLVTGSNVGADDNIDSDPVGGVVSGIAINGNTNNTIDAGFYQLGSIGDRVWKDDNGNGIQDAGEVGVAGVTITLYNAAGQVVASTTTDAFGNYLFSKLVPGNYTLKVTPPANYSLSAKTQGTDVNLDSDFDPSSYTTGTVSLASGQNRTDIDAGLKFSQPSTASVGDRVWLDLNADGVQDAGEPGVSNVLVTLYNSAGTAVRSTYTDVNGLYLFTDVTPGSYTVGVSLPTAFVFTTNSGTVSTATNSDIIPATGRTASFTVNAGDQITYVDAGIKNQVSTNGSIGDFVWNDLNKNGIQDAGEQGIAGVTVRLINATTNTVIATTTTDATGKYIFNDLASGSYQVEFVTPAGYTVTTKLGTDPAASNTDSDIDPATSRSAVFPLGVGQRIVTIDGGYWLTTPPGTGKIGDYVWYDSNQNGVQDAGEPGVPGVTVVLYDAGGIAIKQTVTDTSGKYLFTDLAAGNYTVGFFNIPAGYTFTTQGAGTAANNSDANPATGKTGVIALAAGQVNLDVDAGIRSSMAGTASIGNFVWNDLNNNGIQDAGEPGIGGVTVELLDANGNSIDSDPATAGVQPTIRVTNALGGYLFSGLPAGDYKVKFSNLPAGFNVVTKGAGTDRNLDSDGNPVASGATTTDIVSVAAGEERLDIDLGLNNPTLKGQLGDFVWFDANNNGIQDATEAGVPGVSVSLLNAAGAEIATTVTDGTGFYKFASLADGTYSVRFSNLPAGFSFSAKDQGADDSKDSDADPATGTTGTYTISGGNSNMTVDAGIYSTRAALGDYAWFDANSNGTQDATEKGIPGITVILYNAAGAAVTSAITDENGRYFFSNLNAGTYTVGFSTTPGKLVFTTKDVVAAGDAADSDVDPATGKTGSYTLAAGQVNLTVDAGLKPVIPASIGDFVWYDLNRDGLQTAGEPGVPGVVVTLYNAANQVVGAAITDGNGYYNINNVAPGAGYYLKFSNQPDATAPWTVRYVGGTTAEDNSKVDGFGTTDPFSVSEGQHITNLDAGIYKIFNLSGNVWHDVNGMNDNLVNDTRNTITPPGAPIPTGLRISRVDAVTGKVVAVALVAGNGTFNFPNVAPGTYTLILSPIPGVVGELAPFASLPSGWINTGEHLGLTPGRDAVTNGKLTVSLTTFNVTNANFGIQLNNDDVGIN